MIIAQVNNSDLIGRRFNGHDLQLSLNARGHEAYHLVVEKSSRDDHTVSLTDKQGLFIRSMLRNLEKELSMNSLLFPYGKALADHDLFQRADLLHYHLVHNHFLSVFDYPNLFQAKPSVWTVHDPWIITGHCVHPRECLGWMSGCHTCPQLDDAAFPMMVDKAADMWKIKRRIYKEIDVDIVVSSRLMMDYIRRSPLTQHFSRIHTIPFGIQVEQFQRTNRAQARHRWSIHEEDFVIAFRAEANELKGFSYIIEMLERLKIDSPVTILSVGGEKLPIHLAHKYRVIELGWQNDMSLLYDFYASSDVFIMPSIAESFGLMAIEAMASGCAVVVFEETVLPVITFAPECGIAVPYKSSEGLSDAVQHLIEHPEERRWRGERGKELSQQHYRYEDYVNRHISLYEEVIARKSRE